MSEESEAAPESPDAEEAETREPLYKRRWFKPIALIIALAAMLVLLGILFPPNYWRF
jgi:ferric-dicitrate binding protein FerR (iron transport regulator)